MFLYKMDGYALLLISMFNNYSPFFQYNFTVIVFSQLCFKCIIHLIIIITCFSFIKLIFYFQFIWNFILVDTIFLSLSLLKDFFIFHPLNSIFIKICYYLNVRYYLCFKRLVDDSFRVQDVHDGHCELYPECAHGPLDEDERDKECLQPCKIYISMQFTMKIPSCQLLEMESHVLL